MSGELRTKVENLLRQGKEKQWIWQNFKSTEDCEQLLFLLNELPTKKKRQAFLLLNLPLAGILLTMTCLRILNAIAIGTINIYFFLALVVPIINIYVLKKILRFRRTGYLYLFVLSGIALFQPENHRFLEVTMLGIMLFLSAFLYLRMFPKKEIIKPTKKAANG